MWFFCFKQKTAYEMRISDWSSDVCSSDLGGDFLQRRAKGGDQFGRQVGHETNSVGQDRLVDSGQADFAHCGVQCREQHVFRHDVASGQAVEKGRFPGVGIADERNDRPWCPLALRSLKLARPRSEAHPSALQSLMRLTYAVFCLT